MAMNLKEDKLATLEINLNQSVNEGFLLAFGSAIKTILKAMFGGEKIPVTVRGNEHQVKAFANTLAKEKRYMDAYHIYGLDNANTYKSKLQLNKAVAEFERKTGIPYPLK